VSWASGGWLHPSRRGTSYDGIVAAWDWYPLRAIYISDHNQSTGLVG
jgi:hypothetical protein